MGAQNVLQPMKGNVQMNNWLLACSSVICLGVVAGYYAESIPA